jgi:hypothetical protein
MLLFLYAKHPTSSTGINGSFSCDCQGIYNRINLEEGRLPVFADWVGNEFKVNIQNMTVHSVKLFSERPENSHPFCLHEYKN